MSLLAELPATPLAELTLEQALADRAFWPQEVTLSKDLTLSIEINGKGSGTTKARQGDTLQLADIQSGMLIVKNKLGQGRVSVADTDFFERAREQAEKNRVAVAEKLRDDMVARAAGLPLPHRLSPQEYRHAMPSSGEETAAPLSGSEGTRMEPASDASVAAVGQTRQEREPRGINAKLPGVEATQSEVEDYLLKVFFASRDKLASGQSSREDLAAEIAAIARLRPEQIPMLLLAYQKYVHPQNSLREDSVGRFARDQMPPVVRYAAQAVLRPAIGDLLSAHFSYFEQQMIGEWSGAENEGEKLTEFFDAQRLSPEQRQKVESALVGKLKPGMTPSTPLLLLVSSGSPALLAKVQELLMAPRTLSPTISRAVSRACNGASQPFCEMALQVWKSNQARGGACDSLDAAAAKCGSKEALSKLVSKLTGEKVGADTIIELDGGKYTATYVVRWLATELAQQVVVPQSVPELKPWWKTKGQHLVWFPEKRRWQQAGE